MKRLHSWPGDPGPFRLVCALALFAAAGGCGSNSPLASLTPTIGTASPPSSSDASGTVTLSTPADSASPKDTAPARTGVLVVAIGKVSFTEDTNGRSYSEGGGTALAARSLAKLIYKRTRLRPGASEEVVQILAGDPPPEGAASSLKELANLRSTLTQDADSAASKALLLALSEKVRARAFVLVAASAPAGGSGAPPGAEEKPPTARLVRIDDVAEGPPLIRADAATFTAVQPTDPTSDYTWPNVDDAVTALLGPELPAPLAPRPVAKPVAAEPSKGTPKKDESKPITEKPWFWGIMGGLAAVGLTGLIVSQTVNTSSGTVNITGKVLP